MNLQLVLEKVFLIGKFAIEAEQLLLLLSEGLGDALAIA